MLGGPMARSSDRLAGSLLVRSRATMLRMKDRESRINRRELLLVGAGVAMAKALTVTTACAGSPPKAAGKPAPDELERKAPPAAAQPASALAELTAECSRVGQICIQHCIDLLAKGDTSMAACAQTVHEMLAVCQGVQVLALAGSAHLSQAAALCQAVCESCEAACQVHAGHHQQCGDCAAACKAVAEAAASIA
jgi:Cys-rich four helix bundle protein (predicted Tat secretion target)